MAAKIVVIETSVQLAIATNRFLREDSPSMKPFLLLAASVLAAAVASASVSNAPEAVPASTEPTGDHTVVVELFTSQGCMTCPPADRLLASLPEASGGKVVPLSFHVDFWNSLGWKDPFSSGAWTARQNAYARALRIAQVYTPQAVVDGRSEMVGSDANRLRSSIAVAAARPAGRIALELEPSADRVAVRARVDLPEALRGKKLDLMLALFETGLVTAVGKGENGGKTLHNDYVVRSLKKAGRVSGKDAAEASLSTDFSLEKEWDRSHLGVAAFLQDPGSLEIHGASSALLGARGGAAGGGRR